MVPVYSQIWTNGMKVNTQAILNRRDLEREETAATLRRMKKVIQQFLPFPSDLHEGLLKYDPWYVKNSTKYRRAIADWASTPDVEDDYEQCQQIRGAVSNAWAKELGDKVSNGMNVLHYMTARVMLYDLARAKHVKEDGKSQSDGEARGKIKDTFTKEGNEKGVELIDCINKLAGIEQRIKLFITPYTQLIDPETDRMYPVVSSKLATRRMAASTPNPMQLSKRGESRYVRGFFLADL